MRTFLFTPAGVFLLFYFVFFAIINKILQQVIYLNLKIKL